MNILVPSFKRDLILIWPPSRHDRRGGSGVPRIHRVGGGGNPVCGNAAARPRSGPRPPRPDSLTKKQPSVTSKAPAPPGLFFQSPHALQVALQTTLYDAEPLL